MKKNTVMFLCLICAAFMFTVPGCGKEKEIMREPTEHIPEKVNTDSADYPRELQRGELRAFTVWIDTEDNCGNYGFLLSEYTDPREADLNQIFYTGAGMESRPLTENEQQAYLKSTGQTEIYTDMTSLTTEQINEFLKSRTGFTLEDMRGTFDWTYLEETDIWVHQHGDTNYMPFTCVRGQETKKGVFELDCVPGDGQLDPAVYPSCRLTLMRHGDGYQVVSNVFDSSITYSKDVWKIEEQSFEVDLGGNWGKAVFTSYGPDTSIYATQDASFALVKNGETVYEFPDVMTGNFRERETFLAVLAVSFQDYDGDGEIDVIVLCEYAPVISSAGGSTCREVRLYRNMGDSFRLDRDRMDWLQIHDYCNTVQQVLEHVNQAAADQ